MKLEVRYKSTPADFGPRMRRMGLAVGPAIDAGIHRGGQYLLASLRLRTSQARKLDTLDFIRGWRAAYGRHRVRFHNVSGHAGNVEYGRRAGSALPPIEAISAWAARKLGDARLGWPIAKAIARRGIRPTPILTSKAFGTKVQEVMAREIKLELDRARRRLLG